MFLRGRILRPSSVYRCIYRKRCLHLAKRDAFSATRSRCRTNFRATRLQVKVPNVHSVVAVAALANCPISWNFGRLISDN